MRNIFLIVYVILIIQQSVICKNADLINQSKSMGLNRKSNGTPSFLAIQDKATLVVQRRSSGESLKSTQSVGDITSYQQFKNIIKENRVSVLFFKAVWNGPCRAIEPMFVRAANEYSGGSFWRIDVDQVPQASEEYGVNNLSQLIQLIIVFYKQIRGVPTFKAFKNGKQIGEMIGANQTELRNMISKAMSQK